MSTPGRVDSNTFTMGGHPMPKSTLSPSQGLWIWPLLYKLSLPLSGFSFYLDSQNSVGMGNGHVPIFILYAPIYMNLYLHNIAIEAAC